MSIKGDGLLYPYFKVTLMKAGNNVLVQTEEIPAFAGMTDLILQIS